MSGWGCVHDVNGECTRVPGKSCDPGMKGCILAGRFRFSNDEKNRPPRRPIDQGGDPGGDQASKVSEK